jgi:hypothetical protein
MVAVKPAAVECRSRSRRDNPVISGILLSSDNPQSLFL